MDLATAAAFFTVGLGAAFVFVGDAGEIVACAAFLAMGLVVRVGVFATGLGRCADRSVAFPMAFTLSVAACFARRSGLAAMVDLVGLAPMG